MITGRRGAGNTSTVHAATQRPRGTDDASGVRPGRMPGIPRGAAPKAQLRRQDAKQLTGSEARFSDIRQV